MTGEDICVPSWWRRTGGSVVRVLRTVSLDQGGYGSVTILDADGAERNFSVYAFLCAFEQVPEPARESLTIGSRWVHKTGGAHVTVTAVDTIMTPDGPKRRGVIVRNGLDESRRWEADTFLATHTRKVESASSRWLDPLSVRCGDSWRVCGRCLRYPSQVNRASSAPGMRYYRCACCDLASEQSRVGEAPRPALLPQSALTPVSRWRALRPYGSNRVRGSHVPRYDGPYKAGFARDMNRRRPGQRIRKVVARVERAPYQTAVSVSWGVLS